MSRQLSNISKVWDCKILLGNLFQGSVTLTVKKCFLMIRGNLLCFSLCPLPLILSLGTVEKSLALFSLYPPFRYLYTLIRSPLSYLLSRLNGPRSLRVFLKGVVLQSLNNLVRLCPCLSCTKELRTRHSTLGVASPVLSKGGGSPPLTCCQCFP